jgi:carnosine N-methyltransferase
VNLGPLLYHWADAHTYLAGEQLSVELSLEEVKAAAVSIGFRLLRDELVPAAFLANQR